MTSGAQTWEATEALRNGSFGRGGRVWGLKWLSVQSGNFPRNEGDGYLGDADEMTVIFRRFHVLL
jgi:hypothetical protein